MELVHCVTNKRIEKAVYCVFIPLYRVGGVFMPLYRVSGVSPTLSARSSDLSSAERVQPELAERHRRVDLLLGVGPEDLRHLRRDLAPDAVQGLDRRLGAATRRLLPACSRNPEVS